MLHIKSCCERAYYNQYYTLIWNDLSKIIDNVLRKELFGDDSVICDYKKINDIVYLKEKLDVIKLALDNRTVGISMGIEVESVEDIVSKFCLKETTKYFRNIGINIEPLLDLYNQGIYNTPDLEYVLIS